VSSIPAVGGTPETLASGQSGPLYPVSCGASTCWLDAGDFSTETGILVANGTRGLTQVFDDNRLFHPHGVASDAAHVFVLAEGGGDTISRLAADGSTFDVLAHPTGAGDLVLDDECLYWSAFDGLYSLRKDAAPL
jgi:hypothetical protein